MCQNDTTVAIKSYPTNPVWKHIGNSKSKVILYK